MRITVGHILILAGVGGAAWMQLSTHQFNYKSITDKLSSVTSSVDSLMDLFKSGAQQAPPLATESKVEVPAESPALEVVTSSTPAGPAENVPVVAVQEVKPAVVEAPAPVKKATKRRSKRNRTKAVKDPLLGSEVSLTLSSGREVRGILEERSATSYKIQLPGMGPFTYDAANVKAIKAAK